jgi:His/Glu/Gln/Arg/opine family amino acid ABC transporter permease subunit
MPRIQRIPRLLTAFRGAIFRDVLLFAVFVGAIAWFIQYSATGVSYYWQWYRVPRYLYQIIDGRFIPGPLLAGLWITIKITAISLVLAFAIGMLTAFLRLSKSVLGVALARGYLELIRNTPLLVQMFFIYFVLGPVFDWSAWTSAILALSLFEGAYASEIFRAGIVSINRGQWEAARSIGLGTTGRLPACHSPPGHPEGLAAPHRPGDITRKGFSAGEHHRHLRPDHARADHHRRDLSGIRNLVCRCRHLPRFDVDAVVQRQCHGTPDATT